MQPAKGTVSRIGAAIVFLTILAVGLCVFDDYGISVDEPVERQSSIVSYREINRVLLGREVYDEFMQNTTFGPVSEIGQYRDKYYGVALQLPMVFAEDCYRHVTGEEMPSQTIYQMRHLYTFLLCFLALGCFYFLLQRLFGSRWLALTGVLMLFVFARYFAHSFYNIKDIPFASMSIMMLACTERVLATQKKPGWCLLAALTGALLVSSRIIGALLIVLLLCAMLIQDLSTARQARRTGASQVKTRPWKRMLPYALICCAYPVWLLITPAAWSDPLGFSLGYIRHFASYDTWTGCIVFAGKWTWITDTVRPPRAFLVTWIVMTVPIVNQLLCLYGIAAFFRRGRNGLSEAARATLWIMLVLLVSTLGYQFICQPVVYDDWRHVFFLYPVMVAFAIYGLSLLWSAAPTGEDARLHGAIRRWPAACASALLACSLGWNAWRIVQNHPYEYALVNVAARPYAADFDRDYWELSYYNLIDRILRGTDEPEIRIAYSANWSAERVCMAFSPEDQARLKPTYPNDTEYLLENFWNAPGINALAIDGFEEVDSIWVDDAKISALYRRIKEETQE